MNNQEDEEKFIMTPSGLVGIVEKDHDYPFSPREDSFSIFMFFADSPCQQYNESELTKEELISSAINKKLIVVPVYYSQTKGIHTLPPNIREIYQKVGYIYYEAEKAALLFSHCSDTVQAARDFLRKEVYDFNCFLTNNVYCYRIVDEDDTTEHSSGYWGTEGFKEACRHLDKALEKYCTQSEVNAESCSPSS